MKKALIGILMILTSVLWFAPLSAGEDPYPTKPITLLNPFDAGGTLDIQSRAFAMVAGKILGKPVVVVNKPGAAGMIGQIAGAQASPDGYTITVGSASLSSNIGMEIIRGKKPAITRHDFATIGSFTRSPTLLSVPVESEWNSLADLIKACKAKPDFYAYSSSGLYGATHVSAAILLNAIGVTARHVPYKGGGPALTAVVAKHVDFTTQFPATSVPLMQGKKIKALAVLSEDRLKSISNVPTVKELGYDATYYNWVGLLAPKKTPAPIVEKLRDVAAMVAKDPIFVSTIENVGDEVKFMNGEELAKYLDRESELIEKTLREITNDKKQ